MTEHKRFREYDNDCFSTDTVVDLLNKLADENKTFREALQELKEIGDYQSGRINELNDENEQLKTKNNAYIQDIEVYKEENTHLKLENEELKDFSIITFKHSVGDKQLGTIGIIGPTRMNYSKVISVMKYISKRLNGG